MSVGPPKDPPPPPKVRKPMPLTGAVKFVALTHTIEALSSLSRTEQLDVLRATAHYYGLVVVTEIPR